MNTVVALRSMRRVHPARRLHIAHRGPTIPVASNEVWSMDFMYDQLSDGCTLRLFKVIDDLNRTGLAIDVDFSLPAERVIGSPNQVIDWRGRRGTIRFDNGPEYISGALQRWVVGRGIRVEYIQPGQPQ